MCNGCCFSYFKLANKSSICFNGEEITSNTVVIKVLCDASKIKRQQAITNITETTALIKTALAHIVDAEGEELQKIICLRSVSCKVLFEANQSIQDVIHAIIKHEIVLESKLEIFKDCIKRDCRCGADRNDDDMND